nr:phosphotransferase family protein [Actinomycetota bacterium]
GFLSRQEVLERYATQSGRDVSQVDYYTAFGYWKLACIVEGVYARYVGGSMGSSDPAAFEGFKIQVERCADAAAEAMGRLG